MTEYTLDSIWSDRIKILQPKRGYRFALDAVMLAHFLRCDETQDVLEVGCGVGVIAVLLSHLQAFRSIICVEIQSELAELARENLHANHVRNAELLEMDARELSGRSFDLIYSNPPYRRVGEGRLNPQQQKAVARHELQFRLEDLFLCAGRLLKPAGRLSVILPDFRENDVAMLAEKHGYFFRERRYVHAFASEPPQFLLATLSRVSAPLLEHPRLVIYRAVNVYTEEMERMLRE